MSAEGYFFFYWTFAQKLDFMKIIPKTSLYDKTILTFTVVIIISTMMKLYVLHMQHVAVYLSTIIYKPYMKISCMFDNIRNR